VGAGAAGSSGASAQPGGTSSIETGGRSGDAGAIHSGGEGGLAGTGGSLGFGGTSGALGTSGGSAGLALSGGSAGLPFPPIDIGPQVQSDKLDVLFVVDNSVSMADKQNTLNASLPSFVSRLLNPLCVDAAGKATAQQPTSGAAPCASGVRELTPVTDLHLGVITTSIGGHGGSVCNQPNTPLVQQDDHAELIPFQRDNVASYQTSGYLAFDPTGQVGSANGSALISDLQAMVSAAGEHGCGYEAPLEAMYRFLVDPEPPVSVGQLNQQSTPLGINDALLKQRAAFLRPDSAVAVVILSDESDCSIVDEGVGWFVGSISPMPRSSAACDANPNDACCRSCAQNELAPPAGCQPLREDSVCKTVLTSPYATWDALHDSLNLRCFDQKRRFGFDLLYPVERYSNALSNPNIQNRAGASVDNPLFVARAGKGPRSATLISLSVIVGVPWQDLATTPSLSPGHVLSYLDGSGLQSNERWPLILGEPARNVPPSDPFMRESIAPRSGQNPLSNTPISAPTSTDPTANPINGHEQNIPNFDDLQYACIFALATPKACPAGDSACDCSANRTGDFGAVTMANSPLCQPQGGGTAGTTQYFGKGYPGSRELSLAQQLGSRAAPASICPKTLSDATSPDYAYNPAFNALLGRIAVTLK
jgi:hypothetical protein